MENPVRIAEEVSLRPLRKTRIIALISCLSALCVATNYAMLPLLNVKLMDAIIFIAGFSFGIIPGVTTALTAWLIYGTLNPLGLSLPILVTVMFSETIYGLMGWLLGRNKRLTRILYSAEFCIIFGATGLLLTLAYDLITNAVFGWLFFGSVLTGLLTMNFPMPMGLIHELSNFTLFAFVVPLIIQAVRRYLLR
ncbi:MAG: energy-coupling factor transport system substrate-specific component [Thermoproteota archaeon]|nr:energy-coupling factor transport system substrate-specific component [Thermoproteota archaeon]